MKNYVLITGASSGIGEAFSNYYAEKGKNLILVARSKDKLHTMKKNFEKRYNIHVECLVYDLSIENISKDIYSKVSEKNIFVDTLINCAGFATSGPVADVSFDQQHSEIMVNMVSLFDLTKLFLNKMKEKNQGQIINVASSSAYHPIPTMAVYAATKAFVLSFSESLSMECKKTNIQVFAISPGATDTNFFSNGGGVSYGSLRTPENVVQATIKAMNKGKISKIDGLNNYFTSTVLPRILPRKNMAKMVYGIMQKQLKK
ncbi:dehydrogenase [Enterococcus silesiacus]|uniref:Dehydrogenase n=1 Tax=Enterococcus silesiacus TaxID=332949 RepID=A0A0S3KAM5_9ENTE|nr:SDR family oxidoreductase [Enterococcus silesiacus]ALS01355.1 dehydrogenase [Enterococcus silesiacus]OJG88598.1 dehydrogenase/reductase oxidoreductase [Enterococcus silesiacus]